MNSPTLLAPLQRLRRLCVLVISRKLSVLDSSVAVWPHDSHSSVSAVRLDAPYCLSFWNRRTRVARHDSWTNGTMMPSVELPQLPTSHWAMPKTDRSFHVTTMPSQVLRITYFFFFQGSHAPPEKHRVFRSHWEPCWAGQIGSVVGWLTRPTHRNCAMSRAWLL